MDFGKFECADIAANSNLTREQKCELIHRVPDCELTSYINYLHLFYCTDDRHFVFFISFIIFALLYLFTAIQTIASQFMCICLFRITKLLNLDQNLAGVTLFAFGVATPCIFSAIAGILNDKPRLVVGALFGSACFITQLIIGSIFVLRSFSIKPLSFGRDVLFYLFTIVWIFRIFIVQKGLRPSDAYGFLVFYLVYVLTALVGSRFETMDKEDEDGVDVQKEIEEENAKEERSENCYTWMLPIKPKDWIKSSCCVKCVRIFKLPIELMVKLTTVQCQEHQPYTNRRWPDRLRMFVNTVIGYQFALEATHFNHVCLFKGQISLMTIVFVLSIIVAIVVMILQSCLDNKWAAQTLDWFTLIHCFLMSIFWIYLICEEVVNLLRAISIRFGFSEEIIGLTILAWGNASLDLFADVEIVLANRPRIAFAATISAPLISLLLGVGIPASMRFLSQPSLTVLPLHMSSQMLLISGSVTAGLLMITLVLIVTRFHVFRPFGLVLIFGYLLTMVAEFTLEYEIWSLPDFFV